MTAFLSILCWTVAVIAFLPALIFFVETAASFLPTRKAASGPRNCAMTIIVPAHNESEHIRPTLRNLREQMKERDRLIVVADNCTDDTADVAASEGAETLERTDPDRRGKGYALQYAIEHLRSSPPECVAFFDADCRIAPGSLDALGAAAMGAARPAQALYLMLPPENAPARLGVAAFAWTMINQVRMKGLYALANVTRFTGAGLAAPWAAIAGIEFAAGDITEDHVITFKLAARRTPPLFVPEAEVASFFPETGAASVTQRARWEHGSIGVLLNRAAPALAAGLASGDFKRVALALDALVPPLLMLAGLLAAAAVLCGAGAFAVGAGPLLTVMSGAALFAAALAAGWLRYGRRVLPPSSFGGLVPFLLEKLRIYGREGRGSSRTWTRTGRGGEGS